MLRRIGLVIALSVSCWMLHAQADSLSIMAAQDSLEVIQTRASKAEILGWIDEHTALPFSFPTAFAPLQRQPEDLYRSNYLHIGRPDISQPLLMGFEQPVSAFGAGLYHGYYLSFYPRQEALHQGYGVEIYPFEPSLSYIKGGMGEYEHHFARAGLMKNKLFGFDNFYYQGDILAQNGLWTDITSAETSHKHYLSFPVKNLLFSADYANWNKDVGMSELLPVYWQSTNFMITHRMNHVFARLQSPLMELSVLRTEEKAKAVPFAQMLENSSTQLKLARSHDHGTWKYLAAWEHSWKDANYTATGAFGQDDYKDKLSFTWDSYPVLGLDVDLQLLDWKRGRLDTEVLIPLSGSYLGAYLHMKMGKQDYTMKVKDIYNPGAMLDMLNLDNRREQAAFFRYEYRGFSSLLAIGSQEIKQVAGSSFLSFSQEQPFIRLGMDIDQSWGKWQLRAEPHWSWHQQIDNLYESPEFRFQSVQNLIYHLPYGNKLLAGFAAQGHSGYNASSLSMPYTVEGSTVLDAWLGLGIESRFDFQLGMKNILDSTIYGAAPVPLSIFAQLSWYYLN